MGHSSQFIRKLTCMRGNMLCQRGRSGQLAATDLTGVLLVLFALHTDIDRCRNLVRIRNEQLALRIEVHVVMAPHFVLVNETLLAQLTDVRAFTYEERCSKFIKGSKGTKWL